jgi:hypothetical protein
MTPGSAVPASFEALPNPRGAAVRAAETALDAAQQGFDEHADITAALARAATALRQAGWHAAQRFADTLVMVAPFAGGEFAQRFGAALHDFRAALGRRNLRELACSTTLFDHYRELSAQLAEHTHVFEVAYEDLALACRPIPPATLRTVPGQRLAQLRARYEGALLPVLRGDADAARSLDALDACMAELAGPEPYDVWRLAAGCSKALRASPGAADAKRFYARCNLLLADQARGVALAPRSFVQATLAVLWRDYALYGAAAEDADQVALLHDYGLTVDWHVAGTQASEALWEAGAAQAEAAAVDGAALTRELGVLSINANAYEDFLQTADASIVLLVQHAAAAGDASRLDSAGALVAGDAAYRVGAAACALGLGHVALLADALGLAWRRRAHAGAVVLDAHSRATIDAPDPASIGRASEALRAMLLRVAAGVAPPDAQPALAALAQSIERGVAAPAATR